MSPRGGASKARVAAVEGRRRLALSRGFARARLLAAAVLLLAVLLPFLGLTEFGASTLTRALAFALLVVSLDLLVGLTGLPSLGHAAYFGIGTYTAALLGEHVTAAVGVQLCAAMAVAGLVAALTGSVAVRARGTYFLMLTLAIGEILGEIVFTWDSVTGGSNGLVGVPEPTLVPGAVALDAPALVYWYGLAIFLAGFSAIALIARSPFGRTLRGIRDNEERMRALGYRTTRAKHLIFAVSGAFAGGAGSVWLAQKQFAFPGDLGFELAALALLAVVLGGAGSLWGPAVAGAFVLVILDNVFFDDGLLLLGLLFIAAVYLLPGGVSAIAGRVRAVWMRRARPAPERS